MGLEIVILAVFITLLNLLRFLTGKPIYKNAKIFFTQANNWEVELSVLLTVSCSYFIFFHANEYEGFWHWYLRVAISSTLMAISIGILVINRNIRGQRNSLILFVSRLGIFVLLIMMLIWSAQIGYENKKIAGALISLYGNWCVFTFLTIISFSHAEERSTKWLK